MYQPEDLEEIPGEDTIVDGWRFDDEEEEITEKEGSVEVSTSSPTAGVVNPRSGTAETQTSLFEGSWEEDYSACPEWKSVWGDIKSVTAP